MAPALSPAREHFGETLCSILHGMTTVGTDVDADTGTMASPIEDGGSMELVRLPAWEVKFRRGDNPDELAHFVCCRDLDWRKALCGYEAREDDVVLSESSMICTMCVEVCRGMGVEPGSGQCPIDNQPCPDDEEVDRLINEHTSD
jgi:hypothetical protein